MGQDKSRVCKMCYEQIDSRAKICPYCRQWQWKWAWALRLAGPALAMIGVCVFMFALYTSFFSEGEQFSDYADQIEVLSSEHRFGNRKGYSTVTVVGVLRNNSNVEWSNVQYEVRFFDSESILIDAGNGNDLYFAGLPSQGERAFKVSFPMEFPREEYISHMVRVVYAEEECGLF